MPHSEYKQEEALAVLMVLPVMHMTVLALAALAAHHHLLTEGAPYRFQRV